MAIFKPSGVGDPALQGLVSALAIDVGATFRIQLSAREEFRHVHFYLTPCTTAVLAHALDTAIPWVWVVRHQPKRELGRWRAPVPLSASGLPHDVTVRSLEFDLHLPTARFLEPEFHDHEITLFQMSRPYPPLSGWRDCRRTRSTAC